MGRLFRGWIASGNRYGVAAVMATPIFCLAMSARRANGAPKRRSGEGYLKQIQIGCLEKDYVLVLQHRLLLRSHFHKRHIEAKPVLIVCKPSYLVLAQAVVGRFDFKELEGSAAPC